MPFRLLLIALLSSAKPASALPQGPPQQQYRDGPRPAPFQGVHLSIRVSEARLTKMVEPEYPSEAKAEGVEGEVIFRIIVGTDGRVKEIHLRRGSPLLVEAAVRALSQWRYQPYVLEGKSVEVETLAKVRFNLPSRH
jgi:TonB family protein